MLERHNSEETLATSKKDAAKIWKRITRQKFLRNKPDFGSIALFVVLLIIAVAICYIFTWLKNTPIDAEFLEKEGREQWYESERRRVDDLRKQ